MEPLDIQDKIDAFVKKQMPPEEQAAFQRDMEQNPDLAEAVKQAQWEYDAANLLIEKKIRNWFDEWDKEEITEAPSEIRADGSPPPLTIVSSKTGRFPSWLAVAAAVALLLGAVFVFGPDPQPPPFMTDKTTDSTSQKQTNVVEIADTAKHPPIVADNQQNKPQPDDTPYQVLAHNRTKGLGDSIQTMSSLDPSAKQDPLEPAYMALTHKKYGEAAVLLKKIPADNTELFNKAQPLLGYAYLRDKKYDLAEKTYLPLAESGSEKLRDEAQWNLLMTYLGRYPQKKTSFDRLLNEILKDDSHPDIQRAKALQIELDSLHSVLRQRGN